jgi:MerR family transcriptional regulator, light-induced transcriptional regulator
VDKCLTTLDVGRHLPHMESTSSGPKPSRGRHPIRVVTRRTGVSAAALRAWERRYGAVTPNRTEGGQRLYSDEDIERLVLLRRAVAGGRNISQVAGLSLEELESLVEGDRAMGPAGVLELEGRDGRSVEEAPEAPGSPGSFEFLDQAMKAARAMDPRELERTLTRGAMALGTNTLVDDVMVPLLRRIGLLWARGEMGPATEHMTSSVVRRFLDWVLSLQSVEGRAPSMVVGTTSGQVHEFGALLAAVAAATEGWRVMVLGADLPGEDIGEAVRTAGSDAVAISALLPGEPRRLEREIRSLRQSLGPEVPILLGGPGGLEVLEVLPELGVAYFNDLASFRKVLATQGILALGSGGGEAGTPT